VGPRQDLFCLTVCVFLLKYWCVFGFSSIYRLFISIDRRIINTVAAFFISGVARFTLGPYVRSLPVLDRRCTLALVCLIHWVDRRNLSDHFSVDRDIFSPLMWFCLCLRLSSISFTVNLTFTWLLLYKAVLRHYLMIQSLHRQRDHSQILHLPWLRMRPALFLALQTLYLFQLFKYVPDPGKVYLVAPVRLVPIRRVLPRRGVPLPR